MPKHLDEFGIIARYFAPLAKNPGALGLKDDAAFLEATPGRQWVVTKDILTENVHFFSDDEPKLLAKKLLRVNLSDLAAKGATPVGYLLGLVLPKETDENWFSEFSQGLKEDNQEYNISLLGGDTVAHTGALSLSLTAIGEVESGKGLLRKGAKIGDNVYVTGTLGDSALGLQVLTMECEDLPPPACEYLTSRYFLPQPRLEVGLGLYGIATACMDISDGLIQDLGHLCQTSRVGAKIDIGKIPFSPAAKEAISYDPERLEAAMTGGDDYELLFTVPPSHEAALIALAAQVNVPITPIGAIVDTPGVECIGKGSNVVKFASGGYKHF